MLSLRYLIADGLCLSRGGRPFFNCLTSVSGAINANSEGYAVDYGGEISPGAPAQLSQSEERQNDTDHNDQADDINDPVHFKLLNFTV